MKKILFLLLASFLVLAACGNKEESKSEDKKETKSNNKDNKKDNDKKDNDSKDKEKSDINKDKSEEVVTQDGNSEQQNAEESDQSQERKKIDVSNITNRPTLESVIYGNYSEMEKINAYNSAVANGVIPQGNVTEGPASAAYESSLKVERGEVESVYDNTEKQNSNANDNITVHEDGRRTYKDEFGHDKNILTPEEQAREDEENDISPQERKEVEESLVND